jgi:hypothetical protein
MINGAYYYGGLGSGFDRTGYIAKNQTISVTSSMANGKIPSGIYRFGADGKMIIYHGVVDGHAYDENGFMIRAYALCEYNGDYYYIGDYNKIVTNKKVYLASEILKGTPFTAGYYEFDAEGKMIRKNGPQADGFFYINGVKQKAYQLIEYEGEYYYICDFHQYAKSKKIYMNSDVLKGTGFAAGYYEFDADGKMILK